MSKQQTNQYGQPVDSKGKTLKTRELIAEDIRARFSQEKEPVPYSDKALEVAADYCMDYSNKDWANNVRHGIQLGRSDAVKMLEAAIQEYSSPTSLDAHVPEAIPLSELQKIIEAVKLPKDKETQDV